MSEFEDFVKTELPLRPLAVNDDDQETLLVRRGSPPRYYVALAIAEGEVIGKKDGILQGVLVDGGGGTPVDGDKHFQFIQAVPSNSWVIQHNLEKNPSVEVIDSAGSTVEGDVVYNDLNRITLTFSAPFAGTAFCN